MLNKVLFGSVTIWDLLLSAGILLSAILFSRLIVTYMRRSLKDRISSDHLQLGIKFTYYAVIGLAVLTVLPYLGIKISGLLLAGGFAGIVIGFASQNIVSNLISGLFLMIERPIKIGNAVNIDGNSGTVQDINIMSTIIQTYDGLYVRIPNIKVFTGTLTNYVANIARRFGYVVSIRYQDDAEKAISIIHRIIDENPYILINPKPMIFVDELGDNGVNIVVKIWAPATVWYTVKMELLLKIKNAIEAEGIQIPFPQRVVWINPDIETTVVDSNP